VNLQETWSFEIVIRRLSKVQQFSHWSGYWNQSGKQNLKVESLQKLVSTNQDTKTHDLTMPPVSKPPVTKTKTAPAAVKKTTKAAPSKEKNKPAAVKTVKKNANGNTTKNSSPGLKKSSSASRLIELQGQQQQASPNNHHRLDKFGFIVNMDSRGQIVVDDDDFSDHRPSVPSNSSSNQASLPKIPTYQEYHRTKRREKKWGNMMGRWMIPAQKKLSSKKPPTAPPRPQHSHVVPKRGAAAFAHRRKVVTRLRKGVPDHLRGEIWQWLARVPQKIKQHPGLYQDLVKKAVVQHEEAAAHQENQQNGTEDTSAKRPPSSFTVKHSKSFKNIQDTIERDIHRTYPRHHLFYESDHSSTGDISPEDQEIRDATAAAAHALKKASLNSTNKNGNNDDNDPSEHKGSDPDSNVQPVSVKLLTQNPALRRSHSPTDISNKPLSMMGGAMDSELTDMSEAGASDSERGGISSLCGNDEISDMIRELEGVVGVGEAGMMLPPSLSFETSMNATKATSHNAVSKNGGGSNNASGGGANRQHGGRDLVPERVVDAVGGQASLRRVLKAYSVYDREVGYCQGMNFLAGMFLTLMPEEEAFWLMVSVMNEQPCKMRGLFGEGMKETHLVLYVAEKLIQQFLPKLNKHLEREHVHITMFATQWLLTQYTSSFKFDLVTRVWDSFLGEGWKVTYRVMLALLKVNEAALLQSSFEDILALFREMPEHVQGSVVMKVAMDLPLRRSHILKYEQEWNKQEAAAAAATSAASPNRKKKTGVKSPTRKKAPRRNSTGNKASNGRVRAGG